MSTIELNKLSASTDGKQILIAATATAGDLIHTAVSGTTDFDSVWLYASNGNSTDVTVTVEWGGVGNANVIEKTIPGLGSSAGDGRINILDGEIIQNALTINVFASVTNVIKISGHIHEIRK